jgi:hypothetical protein
VRKGGRERRNNIKKGGGKFQISKTSQKIRKSENQMEEDARIQNPAVL